MKLIAGTSNHSLAEEIAQHLGTKLLDANIGRFADKEINVEINESIRGEDVFVIQSTSYPTNDNLMELLVMVDALKRGSAKRITAVIPYFGYARQDRKSAPRTPISAKLVANLISVAGTDRVLVLDLHAAQIQGFFDIPVDHLFANIIFVEDIKNRVGIDNTVIVSPDIGGVMRARSVAKWCGVDLAIVDKRRPTAGVSEVMNIIGNIEGRNCIMIDDIADSAGTLCNGAKALHDAGAKSIYAYATHGLFSKDAMSKIDNSPIKEMIVSNSISLVDKNYISPKIKYLSVAKMLAEGIRRISTEASMSDLFLK
ncbi:MAG: ribose-phosphate pyrophosphokinase [Alphaproteobacteria bacterium]|jgi:ribose-phosphate pyrophosphokinase|nr:ribose-phosphate pyrophosphokinase [Alphaproteobacteria bacterium]